MPPHHTAMGTGRRGAELLMGSTSCQFFNSMDSVKVKNEFISLLAESNKKASALGRGPWWGSLLLFQL